jgi:fatty acid desaturase
LARWSRIAPARSSLKLALYLGAVAVLITESVSLTVWLPVLICQLLLGLAYAHGLELMHECLHDSMFRSARMNRLVGFLVGLPMLVSFTHYKYQHLHHHRYVGTDKDKELFDYKEASLRNPFSLLIRAANLSRIPTFFCTLFRMFRGTYPAIFEKMRGRARRQLLLEYIAMAALFMTGLALTVGGLTDLVLLAWFIPWLLFGEMFHFLIELPEHLGRDRTNKNIFINSRSYLCNPLWRYIVNGNNYHVEHHLFPRVAIHNLGALNVALHAQARHTLSSYLSAVRQIFSSGELDAVSRQITGQAQ